MVVCFARGPPFIPTILLGRAGVGRLNQTKLQGMIITDDLKWRGHTDYVSGKASLHLYFFRMLRRAGQINHRKGTFYNFATSQ